MNNEKALNAFISRTNEIKDHLERLQSLNDRAYDVEPHNINWSDVASVGHIAQKLADIVEFAFGEAE